MVNQCQFCGVLGDHECRFRFRFVEDYLQLPRNPSKWIVQDLVPIGGVVNIYAKPKIGKTFAFLGIGAAICNGDDEWEGFDICTPGKIAFLQVDTPKEEFADRLAKMAVNKGTFAIADMWQVPEYPFNMLNPNNAMWLKQEMDKLQPVMVIIDTVREVHEEDEDKSTGMKKVLGQLIACCRPATVVLISHQRKDGNNLFTGGGDNDMMDENRGSNYVAGKADVVIRLTEKRLTYKGRATGQKTLPIKKDDNGFIHVIREEDESHQKAKEIYKLHPGESINRMAGRLAELMKISVRTATRRMNWAKENGNSNV